MVLQVALLMWLRTAVNYQYKHGVGIATAFGDLYREGGIPRFYRGALFALLTGPVSRFGDTAANEGIREFFGSNNNNNKNNKSPPLWAITLGASLLASLWRVAITPLDTIKTTLQVARGNNGWEILSSKIQNHGAGVLWDGALGNSLATLAGHYPWFIVHNFLEGFLPHHPPKHAKAKILRRALIGFCSSVASDCVSNGIRVVKTYQQTAETPLGYGEAFSDLFRQSSGLGFAVRGLGLKILSNGLSGILFAVVWKAVLERMGGRHGNETNASKSESQDGNEKAGGTGNAGRCRDNIRKTDNDEHGSDGGTGRKKKTA